ncbi:MAG: methylmalonyl-CoA mutase family protein [Bacteroidales bacterium]
MTEKLFTEFPPVSTEKWEEVINRDLKGADYEKKLVWHTQEGFSVPPYYRAEDLKALKTLDSALGEFPYTRGTKLNNDWNIRQDFCTLEKGGVNTANAKALNAVKKGVQEVGFFIPAKGLPIGEIKALIKDLDLNKVAIAFKGCSVEYPQILMDFMKVVKEKGFNAKKIHASFDFNPLKSLNTKGYFESDKPFEAFKSIFEEADKYNHVRVLTVDAYDFNNAGSSITQELAFALSMGSEYLNILTDLGISAELISKKMKFVFGVGSLYFMEISKFRTARTLWSNIVKDYGVKSTCAMKMEIHAVTSMWNQTAYDSYINMLRNTTEAMSAAVGGVDSMEVIPFDYSLRTSSEFSDRIARNVQHILKEEAGFSKIVDPAAGSYYVENLTAAFIKSAWDLFKIVENKGGYIVAFKDGFIQKEIKVVSDKKDQNIAGRKQTILGSNQFPNFLEKIQDDISESIVRRGSMKSKPEKELLGTPLEIYRASQSFEELRYTTDKCGKRPNVFMLTFGNLAMCRARAQFSCNYFAVAGFKVIDNNRFKTLEEGVKTALLTKADIIVACAADDDYLENVPKINELIGDKAIFVVAGDPACRGDLEAKGIKHFINVRCNVLESLKKYQKMMGITVK